MYGSGSFFAWLTVGRRTIGNRKQSPCRTVFLSRKTPIKAYPTSRAWKKLVKFTAQWTYANEAKNVLLIVRGLDGFLTDKSLWRQFRDTNQGDGTDRVEFMLCFWINNRHGQGGSTRLVALNDVLDTRDATGFVRYVQRRWHFLAKARKADDGMPRVKGERAVFHTAYQETRSRNGLEALPRWAQKVADKARRVDYVNWWGMFDTMELQMNTHLKISYAALKRAKERRKDERLRQMTDALADETAVFPRNSAV